MPRHARLCWVTVLGVSVMLSGCAVRAPERINDPAAESLRDTLAGYYSNERQAEEDADYYSTQLALIPLSGALGSGAWLYLEQSLAEHPNRPQRQEVWRLGADTTGGLIAERYAISQAQEVVRGWENGSLERLQPAQLLPLTGCSLRFEQHDDVIDARFAGPPCGGAPHAARVEDHWHWNDEQLSHWEQGFDADGRQSSGPMNGPEVFDRAGQFAPL